MVMQLDDQALIPGAGNGGQIFAHPGRILYDVIVLKNKETGLTPLLLAMYS